LFLNINKLFKNYLIQCLSIPSNLQGNLKMVKLKPIYLSGIFLILISFQCNTKRPDTLTLPKRGPDNMAFIWGKISLEFTASDTERFRPRPTVTSRILGLVWTAIYDAWSRYDSTARPVYLAEVERRPVSEFTEKNKEIAISHAAFHTLKEYFFSDSILLMHYMDSLGMNYRDLNMDPSTPVGIGNLAAQSIIKPRRSDGSNQEGDLPGSTGRYSDYTGYSPLNTPDTAMDVMRWQPKYFSDGKGGRFAPGCLTPHWPSVKPLILDSASQFRSPPPPALGSEQLKNEVREVVEMQAHLTDEQRALVEFMRDGPKSVQQAGHWLLFAQNVSVRDSHTLDQDVKLYFLIEAAAMDAFIACWDTKMYYDYARPYALVHEYYQNQIIEAWAGPDKGVTKIKGKEWRPYSPETFLCPPFPAYVSGHSTVSAACSEILRLFTGSDQFGEEVKRVPGAMTETNRQGDTVTLRFPTFTNTAEQAGLSRVLGGYHIQVDNVEGLILGRKIGNEVWQKYQSIYK